MLKATIINAYSVRNAGDAAIMLATAKLLADLDCNEVNISSRHWKEDNDFYHAYGIRSIPPLVDFPIRGSKSTPERVARFAISSLAGCIVALLLSIIPSQIRQRLSGNLPSGIKHAAHSDVIVFAGGGYLYSSNRRVNLTLIHVVIQIFIAKLLKKPILMMPQSLGPLTRSVDRALIRQAHKGVSPLIVRDQESVATCTKDIMRPRGDIVILPDIVFYGLPEKISRQSVRHDASEHDVLIIAMDWTWARNTGSSALDQYIEKLARVAKGLAGRGYRVALAGNSRMPEQGQDDFDVAARVVKRVGLDSDGVTMLKSDTDMHALLHAMEKASLVVGTRLHSCILSLISGTPTIALAYQPKTNGTFRLLEMDAFVHDVEAFNPDEVLVRATDILDNELCERERVAHAVSDARQKIYNYYRNQKVNQ